VRHHCTMLAMGDFVDERDRGEFEEVALALVKGDYANAADVLVRLLVPLCGIVGPAGNVGAGWL